MIKVYQKYVLKSFLKSILTITAIFYSLVLILNIFEELNYFKNLDTSLFIPIWLNFLNAPSLLYNIFPFIFLISTQFFLLNLIEKNEILILKNIGLDNYSLIKLLALASFVMGLLIILIFYNLSAKFKFFYLDLKNDYASDNKYLAVINENGLWIRDEMDGGTNIINADKIEKENLKNIIITQFDNKFNVIRYISSEEGNINNNIWVLKNAKISVTKKQTYNEDIFLFKTNFNLEKINNLFSSMESLTIPGLLKQKKHYSEVGYSTNETELHLQKIYSFPLYLMVMTVLSSVLMLNVKHNKPKLFYLVLGILLSVIIFYINHLSNTLGENNKLPIILSVWLPHLIISMLIGIGLVTINEK